MFIKNITAGAFITDAGGDLTQKAGDVVIGVVLSLTGRNSETGLNALAAINLAFEHANLYYSQAEGMGIHFSVEVRDSGSDPVKALTQVKALHKMGINLLIGPTNSGELSAVAAYARENKIVLINTTSTATSLARPDDFIVRLTADDTHQAKALTRLIAAQDKQHLVLIYRDDPYGQDFHKALAEIYKGGIDAFSYAATETNFSAVFKRTAAGIEKVGNYKNTAVIVVGLSEITKLLEQVEPGALTAVDWYGSDGICQNRQFIRSPKALAVAKKTHFTCSNVDIDGQRIFLPLNYAVRTYLTRVLGNAPTWNEFTAYDASWLAMNAFAMTRPDADSRELWGIINNPYGAGGIGALYIFNANQDQSLSSYTFYTVTDTAAGPGWKATALYRDIPATKDDLYIIKE